MSDTNTITAEERDLWASTAAARINAVTPERQCEITAQERLVNALKALEQAEARAEKAQAEVARLTKMVDWLAGRCSEELGFSDSLFKERKATVNEWKEAARRAVAAGEEPCQK